MGTWHRIGEVAQILQINPKTIRYYDEVGLIKPSRHTEAGYRQYSAEDIERLELVVALRYAGCTLTEISLILENAPNAAAMLERRVAAIDEQICKLQKSRDMLTITAGNEQSFATVERIRERMRIMKMGSEERQVRVVEQAEKSAALLLTSKEQEMSAQQREQLHAFFTISANLAVEQADAYAEMQRLLQDGGLIDLLRDHVSRIAQRLPIAGTLDEKAWRKRMRLLRRQLREAMKRGESPASPNVQRIAAEHEQLYAQAFSISVDEYELWRSGVERELAGSLLPQFVSAWQTVRTSDAAGEQQAKRLLRDGLQELRKPKTR